jgi:class 3 adenylate cyclase
MALIHSPGPRTRRFLRLLERRELVPLTERARFDEELFHKLGRLRAIVFTDTADFTIRSVRYGLPHFMMSFLQAAKAAAAVVAKGEGELVKLEGDSLMLRYPSVPAACRGVDAIEALLRRFNRGRREDELVRFSYGIGWGALLDIEHDLFGLEVNLASKLGEDLARPGEVLLTPAAAAALDRRWSRRLEPYAALRLVDQQIEVQRLRPKR